MNITLPKIGEKLRVSGNLITVKHILAESIPRRDNTYQVRIAVSEDGFNFYQLWKSKPANHLK